MFNGKACSRLITVCVLRAAAEPLGMAGNDLYRHVHRNGESFGPSLLVPSASGRLPSVKIGGPRRCAYHRRLTLCVRRNHEYRQPRRLRADRAARDQMHRRRRPGPEHRAAGDGAPRGRRRQCGTHLPHARPHAEGPSGDGPRRPRRGARESAGRGGFPEGRPRDDAPALVCEARGEPGKGAEARSTRGGSLQGGIQEISRDGRRPHAPARRAVDRRGGPDPRASRSDSAGRRATAPCRRRRWRHRAGRGSSSRPASCRHRDGR